MGVRPGERKGNGEDRGGGEVRMAADEGGSGERVSSSFDGDGLSSPFGRKIALMESLVKGTPMFSSLSLLVIAQTSYMKKYIPASGGGAFQSGS